MLEEGRPLDEHDGHAHSDTEGGSWPRQATVVLYFPSLLAASSQAGAREADGGV